MEVEGAEVDLDDAVCVRAQVIDGVDDEVRAVALPETGVEDVVLDVVLVVERLTEPGGEMAAGRDTVRIIGRERDRRSEERRVGKECRL